MAYMYMTSLRGNQTQAKMKQDKQINLEGFLALLGHLLSVASYQLSSRIYRTQNITARRFSFQGWLNEWVLKIPIMWARELLITLEARKIKKQSRSMSLAQCSLSFPRSPFSPSSSSFVLGLLPTDVVVNGALRSIWVPSCFSLILRLKSGT